VGQTGRHHQPARSKSRRARLALSKEEGRRRRKHELRVVRLGFDQY
jgi:hypothetical protein